MDILEALDRADLFGSAFVTGDWNRWRSFLAAVYALPMDDEALATYRRHTGRETPAEAPAREVYAVVGRRGGKSRIAALIAAYAASRDYRARLAPGESAVVACIAADRAQAQVVLGYIRALIRDSKLLRRLVARETAEAIELKNRVRIEVTTASHRTTRGFSFAAVIIDELAFLRSDDSNEPDTEVLNAVRPGLATLGGLIVGISSPYSRRGALWNAYRDHYGKDGDPVLVWQAASRDMNPSLPESLVQEALAADEAAASAEYLGQFRRDLESFLSREAVDACTVPGRFELPPTGDTLYVAFTDPSGGSRDSFALAVAHHERRGEQTIAVLDYLAERRPPFSPDAIVEEYAAVLKTYRCGEVVSDRYAGAWVVEAFQRHGITCTQAADAKSIIYANALPLLNGGRCELLDQKRLKTQLLGLERRTARGGRDSIDHPPNGQDDAANAALGALTLAAAGRDAGEVLAANLAHEPAEAGWVFEPQEPGAWARDELIRWH